MEKLDPRFKSVLEARKQEVIITETCVGTGEEESPKRCLTQVWSLTGEFIASSEPIDENGYVHPAFQNRYDHSRVRKVVGTMFEESAAESCIHVLRGLISYHERMTMGNYPERDFYLDALKYALACVEDRNTAQG